MVATGSDASSKLCTTVLNEPNANAVLKVKRANFVGVDVSANMVFSSE